MHSASHKPRQYDLQSASRLAMVLALSVFGAGCSMTAITERAVDSKMTTAAISPQTVATGDKQVVSDEATVRNAVSSIDPNASSHQIPWANADTGSRGAITSLVERQEAGELCRSFTTTRESFDGVALYKGKACMDDGGSWQMLAFSPQ